MYAVTGHTGLGQATASNPLTNIETAVSSFGLGEWALLIGGAIAVFTVASATTKGARAVKSAVERRRSKRERRKEAQRKFEEAGGYGFDWGTLILIGGLITGGLFVYTMLQQQQPAAGGG